MAEVVPDVQHEFWRPPTATDQATAAPLSPFVVEEMAEVCGGCGTEFMIGARFCHACGLSRPIASAAAGSSAADARAMAALWARKVAMLSAAAGSAAKAWRKIEFPTWLQYLHFHEIKRSVGLPTASLIAFIIGVGCVAGALGISFFYKASNLAEFQAIQMWRIEWLLSATASFVAGILLKKPTNNG